MAHDEKLGFDPERAIELGEARNWSWLNDMGLNEWNHWAEWALKQQNYNDQYTFEVIRHSSQLGFYDGYNQAIKAKSLEVFLSNRKFPFYVKLSGKYSEKSLEIQNLTVSQNLIFGELESPLEVKLSSSQLGGLYILPANHAVSINISNLAHLERLNYQNGGQGGSISVHQTDIGLFHVASEKKNLSINLLAGLNVRQLDLVGAHINELDVSGVMRFERFGAEELNANKVTAIGTSFSNSMSLHGAEISGSLNLRETNFNCTAVLGHSIINGYFVMDNLKGAKKIDLNYVQVKNGFRANNLVANDIVSDLNLQGFTSHQYATLIGSKIGGKVWAHKASFLNGLDLSGFTNEEKTTVGCFVSLNECLFKGRINMAGLTVGEQVCIDKCNFSDLVDESSTLLSSSKLYLRDLQTGGSFQFIDNVCNGISDFSSMKIGGSFQCHDNRFSNKVTFEYSQIKDGLINFRSTSFASDYQPDLHGVDMQYPYKKWTRDQFLNWLMNAWFKFWRISEKKTDEECYRILKRLASNGHNHEEELDFFAYEMRAKRYYRHRWVNFVYNVAYDWLSSYGRGWGRALVFLCVTWIVGAVCFAHLKNEYRPYNSQTLSEVLLDTDATEWTTSFASLIPIAGQTTLARQIADDVYCPAKLEGEGGLMRETRLSCQRQLYATSAIQSIFSAFFLFLLGLALRNKGRMR